jgi:uncharacterized small protein (DUF1192 family)
MTYTSHTASRIREEVYRRHYLGRAALEERRKFLAAETERAGAEFEKKKKEEREAAGFEDCCNRVLRFLPELKLFSPSIAESERLAEQLDTAEKELAAVDTQSFKDLETKRGELEGQLNLLKKDNVAQQQYLGSLSEKISACREDLDTFSR